VKKESTPTPTPQSKPTPPPVPVNSVEQLAKKIRNATGSDVLVDSDSIAVRRGSQPALVYEYGSKSATIFGGGNNQQ
jgi:hypothetical protein